MVYKTYIRPFFYKGRFTNHPGEKPHHFILPTLYMMAARLIKSVYSFKAPQNKPFLPDMPLRAENIEIIWLGHASFIIRAPGVCIVLDPVAGHLGFSYARKVPFNYDLIKKTKIDVVLISHNHWDHLDTTLLRDIQKINQHVQIHVPYGDKAWLEKDGFQNVFEWMWWDPAMQISDCTIRFLPAHHWSQRGLFDRNKSLWGSWMITIAGRTVYFGGDTAFSEHFARIAEVYSSIDLALLPIGPVKPREWLCHSHLGPEEALRAMEILQANLMIPMHWGTYPFGIEELDYPKKVLEELLINNALNKVNILDVSQSYFLPTEPAISGNSVKKPSTLEMLL